MGSGVSGNATVLVDKRAKLSVVGAGVMLVGAVLPIATFLGQSVTYFDLHIIAQGMLLVGACALPVCLFTGRGQYAVPAAGMAILAAAYPIYKVSALPAASETGMGVILLAGGAIVQAYVAFTGQATPPETQTPPLPAGPSPAAEAVTEAPAASTPPPTLPVGPPEAPGFRVCAACRQSNPAGNAFCEYCGGRIDGAPGRPDVCAACGGHVRPSAAFCTQCGTKV